MTMAVLAPKAMAKFPNDMTFDILTVTAEENRVLIEFREFWDPLYALETMFEGNDTL